MNADQVSYKLVFDVADDVSEAEAEGLVAELIGLGDRSEIAGRYAGRGANAELVQTVVAIATSGVAGTAGLGAVAAFLYRVFHKGVLVDLTGDTPIISKNDALPRGALLVRWHDGREELRRDMTDAQIVSAMKAALSSSTATSEGG